MKNAANTATSNAKSAAQNVNKTGLNALNVPKRLRPRCRLRHRSRRPIANSASPASCVQSAGMQVRTAVIMTETAMAIWIAGGTKTVTEI